MIKCEKCIEYPCCDFCAWYDFNGGKNGIYLDKGYCRKHKKKIDPEGDCCDFVCNSSGEGKDIRKDNNNIDSKLLVKK